MEIGACVNVKGRFKGTVPRPSEVGDSSVPVVFGIDRAVLNVGHDIRAVDIVDQFFGGINGEIEFAAVKTEVIFVAVGFAAYLLVGNVLDPCENDGLQKSAVAFVGDVDAVLEIGITCGCVGNGDAKGVCNGVPLAVSEKLAQTVFERGSEDGVGKRAVLVRCVNDRNGNACVEISDSRVDQIACRRFKRGGFGRAVSVAAVGSGEYKKLQFACACGVDRAADSLDVSLYVGIKVAGVIFVRRELFAAAEVNGAHVNLAVNGGCDVRNTHHAKLVCAGEETAVFGVADKLFGDVSALVGLDGGLGIGIVKADIKSCRAVYDAGIKCVGNNELAFAGSVIFLEFCRVESAQNAAFVGKYHGGRRLIILGIFTRAVGCRVIFGCDGVAFTVLVIVLNDVGNGKVCAAELNAFYQAVSAEVCIVVSAVIHIISGGCKSHYRVEEHDVGVFSVGKSDKIINDLLLLGRECITALGPIVIGNIRGDAVVGVAKGCAGSNETAGEELIERNDVIFSVVDRLQPFKEFFGAALVGNAFVISIDFCGIEFFVGHNELETRCLSHIFNTFLVDGTVVEGDVNDLFAVCIDRTANADANRNGLGVNHVFVACVGLGLISEHNGGEAVLYAHELAVFNLNAVARNNVRGEFGGGNDRKLVAVGFGFDLVAVIGLAYFKTEVVGVHKLDHVLDKLHVVGGDTVGTVKEGGVCGGVVIGIGP